MGREGETQIASVELEPVCTSSSVRSCLSILGAWIRDPKCNCREADIMFPFYRCKQCSGSSDFFLRLQNQARL